MSSATIPRNTTRAMKGRTRWSGALVSLAIVALVAACTSAPDDGDEPAAGGSPDQTSSTKETVSAPLPASTQEPEPADTGWDTEWSRAAGIELLASYDSSGEPAWDPEAHPVVFVTSEGPGYGDILADGVTEPGFAIIDSETREVVASRHFDLGQEEYYEPHGSGVSPDGRWIYIPTADPTYDLEQGDTPGRLLVINARTLKLHQVLGTRSVPHHIKAYTDAEGNPRVLAYDFNWQIGAGVMRPGSGVYALDPGDDNRVVGGINADKLQFNPYLAFAAPEGDTIWIGLPPGPITEPNLSHELKGAIVEVDALTWEPVRYYPAGYDPIWASFSSDGDYVYFCDGGADEVFKIDREEHKIVEAARTGVHGVYGCHLGWDDTNLWTIEKGEASHNRGKMIGLVDVDVMAPRDNFYGGWIRADHGTVHPDPDRNELWVTSNSTFEVVVWDMGAHEVIARIPMPNGGSTHSGAFVSYDADFTGQLMSDQNGLHGTALETKRELLGTDAADAPDSNDAVAEGSSEAEAQTFELTMTENAFEPAALAAPAGTEMTIVARNESSVSHNMLLWDANGNQLAAYEDGQLVSQDGEATITWTAAEPGTYTLVCTLHPGMEARVEIE